MARTEIILSAFVASPGDVQEERELLEDIVRELNLTWRKTLGISLDLVKWETHTTPGIGADPQKVINQSIGDEYDIFIGLMWSRFGTPTTSHQSGTEEEFTQAHERWKKDSTSVRIMFYFNQIGIAPDLLDLVQAQKIKDFKESLGNEGMLYWNYKDTEHFKEILRLHLSRVVQDWFDPSTRPSSPSTALSNPASETATDQDGEDGLGLIDLIEGLEDAITAVNEVSARITESLSEVGKEATARSAELDDLKRNEQGNIIHLKHAKRIMNRAAEDLDRFNARLGHEIPNFKEHNRLIAKCSAGLAIVMEDFNDDSYEDLAELDGNLGHLTDGLGSIPDGVGELRNSVAGLPRFSVRHNRSKKASVKILDSFLDSISESMALYSESRAIIRTLKEQHPKLND